MKKTFLLLLMIIAVKQSFACDLCGCSSGNYFIGPFPQFTTHFAGIRYSFQRFNTVLKDDNTQFSKDFYQTTELMAGAKIKNRWQLLAFVPYNVYHVESDDGIKHNKGLGDITFMGNYDLINQKTLNRDTNTVFQQLWIGGGVKLPSGKFAIDTGQLVSSANMQVGTGSFDFLINAIYTLQIDAWGFNLNANYKINQKADNFKFGNRFTTTVFLFRSFHVTQVSISPNVGLLYETLQTNKLGDENIAETGGNVLMSAFGFEVRVKKIEFGCNVQLPLTSNLSVSQTDAKIRGMFHVSYLF